MRTYSGREKNKPEDRVTRPFFHAYMDSGVFGSSVSVPVLIRAVASESQTRP